MINEPVYLADYFKEMESNALVNYENGIINEVYYEKIKQAIAMIKWYDERTVRMIEKD